MVHFEYHAGLFLYSIQELSFQPILFLEDLRIVRIVTPHLHLEYFGS